jgi:nitrate reductase delta subunit
MSELVQGWGDNLGRLFAYPDGRYAESLAAARAAAERLEPAALPALERFAQALAPLTPAEHEELFTRTFDFDPRCALEIGWHLFGEDYNRGALLVRLRSELRRHGIEERGELPDHLTLLLPLLARMEPAAAGEFYACCLFPALNKLHEGLSRKDSPYRYALDAVLVVLARLFGQEVKEDANDARVVEVP